MKKIEKNVMLLIYKINIFILDIIMIVKCNIILIYWCRFSVFFYDVFNFDIGVLLIGIFCCWMLLVYCVVSISGY